MTPEEAKALKPGDPVYHNQTGGAWKGEFVRLEGPYHVSEHSRLVEVSGDRYRIHWKGWNPYDPEQVDWTWDWAIDRGET